MPKKHSIKVDIPFRKLNEEGIEAALNGFEKVAQDWKAEAVNSFSDHTYTGDIKNRIDVRVNRDGKSISADFSASHPAAATLHDGRGKNKRFPPVDVIRKWIRRRLGKSQEEAEALSYVIGRKIAKEGFWRTKSATGSKYAIKESGTWGLGFAEGPLVKKGKSDGTWERFVAKEIREVLE